MGKELFANRKIDEDTRILSAQYQKNGGFDLLLEQWVFDGIKARSLIFVSDQIRHLSDRSVEDLARNILKLRVDEQRTFKRKDDYTYVNFDFKI